MRLDLLQELLFLDQTLGVDALVVANLAQLLDPQLLPVGRLRVKFLVVLELSRCAGHAGTGVSMADDLQALAEEPAG